MITCANQKNTKTDEESFMNGSCETMTKEELLKLSPGELTDLGICPTCFNRENGGALYGDLTDKMLYEDDEIECFFVGNPRAEGHMCIATIDHYHDMSEAPDHLNEKVVRFAKQFMHHYHVQLIPRYPYEKRGSRNFVKERKAYQFDKERYDSVRERIAQYIKRSGSAGQRI